MATSALQYCNNCGRRIQPHQKGIEVKLRRQGNQRDHYHETWEGCYESTRESGRFVTTRLDAELLKITPIY